MLERIKLHLPLIRAVTSAGTVYAGALVIHSLVAQRPLFRFSFTAVLCFLAGGVYTHAFEYLYHRVAMHEGIRFLEIIKKTHLEHHRIFDGDKFRSRDPNDLRFVATDWCVFPALLALHYAAFVLAFPAGLAPVFFLGVTCHFLAYEVGHWYIHVSDNLLDRLLSKIPLVASIRARQIRHHYIHHAIPIVNFNFVPPYGGDYFSRTHSATLPGESKV